MEKLVVELTNGCKITATRFESEPSFDRTERENLLDKIDEGFGSQYYRLDSELSTTEKIAEYMLLIQFRFILKEKLKCQNRKST